MRAVIIGNSAAGLAGAETLRRLAPEAAITIVSDEPYPPYCRPLLTYLLAGDITPEALWLKAKDYYQQWRFQVMLGRRVVRVEPATRTVALADGDSLSYDRLLVASGARPLWPGIPGEGLQGVFTIRTLEQFQAMQAMLRPGMRVAVVGSGLVGIKTAQAYAQAGFEVTLVARKSQVLSNLLDKTAADLLHEALRRIGVQLRFHAIPALLSGKNGRVTGVVFTDGSEIPADLVIFGIGVTPNTEFLAAAGLSDPQGLLVNGKMQTALENIFAAGDCVLPCDRLTGQRSYFAIWPAAVEQGRIAGANMAGFERTYGGLLAQNTFAVGDIRIIAGGLNRAADPDCEVHTDYDLKNHRYRRLVIQAGRLVGVILVGQVEDAGVYLSLISNQTPLTTLPADPRQPEFQIGKILG